jgi:hypothetical protein
VERGFIGCLGGEFPQMKQFTSGITLFKQSYVCQSVAGEKQDGNNFA